MARTDPHHLDRLIERILDAEPADWSARADADGDAQAGTDALCTLADVARAFRRFGTPPREPERFRWGPLSVLEPVAHGGSSEIHRAWDPALGITVALKLLAGTNTGSRAFLDEARRLARVRHPNVLRVYGAAAHDGRAGLWCEWIDGENLAERVARNGPLGVEEAIAIGIALCRALAAVHAAGLLHGDVKPENVLREHGGRIVLVDLGAGGEPAAVNACLRSHATRAWLAPEVLDGALRTPQHDLYALGGVLQFLLDGRRPVPAEPVAMPSRPDLPPALRALLARARAPDPAQRFDDAARFEQALLACLEPRRRAPNPRRAWLLAGTAAAIVLGVALLATRFSGAPAPLQVELQMQRLRGDRVESLADGDSIQIGDRLSFRLHGAQPVWLYAFNADDRGALQRLFPLKGLEQSNPLPGGRDLDIPGPVQGRTMRFEVSSQAAMEDFLVIAAGSPIARFESPADPGGATAGIADAELRTRGTALVVPAGPDLPATHLDTLADELARESASLRLWRFRLPHARGDAGAQPR